MAYVERTDEELLPLIMEIMKLHPAPEMKFFRKGEKRYSAKDLLDSVAKGDMSFFIHFAEMFRVSGRHDNHDPFEDLGLIIKNFKEANDKLPEALEASKRLLIKLRNTPKI